MPRATARRDGLSKGLAEGELEYLVQGGIAFARHVGGPSQTAHTIGEILELVSGCRELNFGSGDDPGYRHGRTETAGPC